MNQTPPRDKICAACPCARAVAEYARRKGMTFARAMALLENQMEGRPLSGIGPVEICPCEPAQAAACPVFAVVRRLAAACDLEPAQWLETADVLIDGEYEATARDVTDEPQETPVPAAPQSQPEQEPEPAPRRFVWKLSPRLTGLLAAALAVLLVSVAFAGGYAVSLNKNGTYEAGYAAAKAEGTYEQGQADGYEQGHSEGYREGLQEGFDQGKEAGYSEGYSAGSKDVQQAHSDAQQAQTDAENARRALPVWTSWLGNSYHLDPECPRLWGGEETTLGEAEDAGYSPCSRCAK